MRMTVYSVLIAALVLSTLPFGTEDGDDCENCASHGDTAHECQGHQHGDSDDRHDGPESPCSHNQDFHCCCSHMQVMIDMAVVEWSTPIVGESIDLASQDLKVDPSQRQTFHIPIA